MADEQLPHREIYWAYHWYGEDERTLKTIGHFSTEAKAKAAVELVSSQPGFRDHPDGFEIHAQMVDVVCWPEGFVSA